MTKDEAINWAITQLEPECEHWSWVDRSTADRACRAMEALSGKPWHIVVHNHEHVGEQIYIALKD